MTALYAAPRPVSSLDECWFYHTMEVPGQGLVRGSWDLRDGVKDYLGGVELRGKRVLEVGPANGFLTFHMEGQGAEVISCELSQDDSWDVVPFAGDDAAHLREYFRDHLRKLNNAYWLAHRAFRSRARVVYCPVYDLPDEVGQVDVGTFACVLLHLRDPFRALERGLRLVRERAVVVEVTPPGYPPPPPRRRWFGKPTPVVQPEGPGLIFLPDARTRTPRETWWRLSPEVVARFLGVLGFEVERVNYHTHLFDGNPTQLYTVVARRTSGQVAGRAA